MDKRRVGYVQRKRVRCIAAGAAGLIAALALGWVLFRLEPAVPGVDAAVVFTDTVERCEMLTQVRGIGTLVPETVVVIAASDARRVEQRHVEPGQPVRTGIVLLELSSLQVARVSDPTRRKAELKIPEALVNDVSVGKKAEVDTRNGLIDGQVSRIDPAAIEGTVLVDIKLLGEMSRGARPDLSVDGTIELERLENVLHVGRPNPCAPGELDGAVQARGGWEAHLSRPGSGGQGLDQHDQDPFGIERGGRSGPLRHGRRGRLRQDPARMSGPGRGPGKVQARQ